MILEKLIVDALHGRKDGESINISCIAHKKDGAIIVDFLQVEMVDDKRKKH